ncbi:hypothetical protein BCO71171_03398 [Burkholderia contaminans]|uniref:Uncharacterized protein n=1 Tax=Burkholderia contaminans TaxID=488447 RepID=A0A6P2YV53_9BURK|nr:hypothetical protein BCO71171_03398 [Burkholderia contaminans]
MRLRETCIRTLPKSLTFASRKRSPNPPEKAHPGSWRPSPKRPGCPHRHFPQFLTHAPRKGSPAAPAGAHRPFPGRLTECSCIGSPSAPVSTHPNLPGEAHRQLPKNLTFWASSNFRRWNATVNACGHLVRNGAAGRISRQAVRVSRCRIGAICASIFPPRTGADSFSAASLSRQVRMLCIPDRQHSERAGRPETSTACNVSARRATDRRYGCNFILKPTTPGSSVVDTANPHAFASEIIAVFSRSASPTIQAVPRERA